MGGNDRAIARDERVSVQGVDPGIPAHSSHVEDVMRQYPEL